VLVVGGLLLAYAVGLLLAPPVQTATRTLLLLPELIELPVRPLSALTAEPTRRTINYGSPADRLDVYLPAGNHADGTLPGVVLALGVHPPPLDDPDIVRVASAMARSGAVVGVPESTALRQTRIPSDEPTHLADAVLAMQALPEVNDERVGLAGFSAGASLALIAAADPRIADVVRYVSVFGGYASAETLLVDVATRSMALDGEVVAWAPDAGIRRDILALLLAAVEPGSRDVLRAALEPIVAADEPPAGPDPALAAALEGDALAVYLLLTAPERDAAQAAIGRLSPPLREELRLISPLAFVDGLRAPVLLMHGENDSAIPISHALALSEALPSERLARFTRFGRFEHGQPGQAGLGIDDLADVWALTRYLHDVVAATTE